METKEGISRENSAADFSAPAATGHRMSELPMMTGGRQRLTKDQCRHWFYPDRSIADLKSPVFWRDIIVEMICCAYFITLVNWVLVSCNPQHYEPGTTHFGLFAGFLIFALVEAWHPLCGGLLNPAGVWGFWLCGRMSLARAILATGAEIAGAACGARIGYSLTPEEQQKSLNPIMPNVGLGPGKGAVIEGLVTFHLILVALSVTNPKKHSVLAGVAIAFCKGSGILAAGTHTGGLANPIVPFGPAVATGNFTHHFVVYWVGPYIGATVSAVLFKICTEIGERYKPEQPIDDIEAKLPEKFLKSLRSGSIILSSAKDVPAYEAESLKPKFFRSDSLI